MKKLLFGLLVLFCVSLSYDAAAQLTRAEKKEWKRRLKNTTPEQLKNIVEENESLKTQVQSLNAQITSLQSRISEKDASMSDLRDQVASLESQLAAARQELDSRPSQPVVQQPEPDPEEDRVARTRVTSGVIFRVQIGSFRNKDLSRYFDNHPNFAGEITDDGTQKITLGEFRDYWEANTFKKYLRDMGVRDAWIVPYKDGQRVPIKDVLEGVI